MINMVFGPARWDGISKTREFGQICAGYNKEKDFWDFEETVPNLSTNMIFLDLGCGPGRMARFVAPKVKVYYGIDIHSELIGIAKEHYKNYSNVFFAKSNGHDIDIFVEEYFDYVYERLLFIHIPKNIIIEYLVDCYRVLKPGGFLYMPDLPKAEFFINGLSFEEIRSVLDRFSNTKIEPSKENPQVWQLECTK